MEINLCRVSTLWIATLSTLAIIALALAGCGAPSTATTTFAPNQVTQVRITHKAALSTGAPAATETIHNATSAQRLYDATVALPLFPKGVMNCSADTGETYTLDFTRENSTTVDVVAHSSGCQQITISGQATREATTSYWALLRQIASAPHS